LRSNVPLGFRRNATRIGLTRQEEDKESILGPGSAPRVSRAAQNTPCMAGHPPIQSNSAIKAGRLTPDPCMGEILWTPDPELPPGTPREGPGAPHLPLLETGEGLAHRCALGGTLLDWTTRDFGSGGEAVTGLRIDTSARNAYLGPPTCQRPL
jgi:hypothetical protein